MTASQIFPRLHLEEPGAGPLELEAQPLPGIKPVDGRIGRDDQLDVAIVEFVHQRDESSRRVFIPGGKAPHVADEDGVEDPNKDIASQEK